MQILGLDRLLEFGKVVIQATIVHQELVQFSATIPTERVDIGNRLLECLCLWCGRRSTTQLISLLGYFIQNCSRKLPLVNIPVETRVSHPRFITIRPGYGHISINVVYEVQDVATKPDNGRYMGVDIGIDNLASCLDSDGNALLFKGKTIKSINQYFNKKKARLVSQLSTRGEVKTSARLERLSTKRKNKISWHMHNISSMIVNYAVSHKINTIIIGHNPEWKQGINIGRVNNQKFVSIPFSMLIQQIQYKAQERGINVIVTEESYTSKCSFLDNEDICRHEEYSGRRIKRGLFTTSCGIIINADINAAGNIMRKVVPVESLTQGIEVGAVQPQTVHYAHS